MSEEQVRIGTVIDLGNSKSTLRQLQGAIKDAKIAMEGLDQSTKDYDKALSTLTTAQGDYTQAVGQTIRNQGQLQNHLNSVTNAINGTLGGFQALQGIMALTGGENEKLVSTLVKLQAVASIASGFKSFTEAIKGSTLAMRLFNTAVASNPLGLLLVSVTSAIALFVSLSDSVRDSKKELEDMKDFKISVSERANRIKGSDIYENNKLEREVYEKMIEGSKILFKEWNKFAIEFNKKVKDDAEKLEILPYTDESFQRVFKVARESLTKHTKEFRKIYLEQLKFVTDAEFEFFEEEQNIGLLSKIYKDIEGKVVNAVTSGELDEDLMEETLMDSYLSALFQVDTDLNRLIEDAAKNLDIGNETYKNMVAAAIEKRDKNIAELEEKQRNAKEPATIGWFTGKLEDVKNEYERELEEAEALKTIMVTQYEKKKTTLEVISIEARKDILDIIDKKDKEIDKKNEETINAAKERQRKEEEIAKGDEILIQRWKALQEESLNILDEGVSNGLRRELETNQENLNFEYENLEAITNKLMELQIEFNKPMASNDDMIDRMNTQEEMNELLKERLPLEATIAELEKQRMALLQETSDLEDSFAQKKITNEALLQAVKEEGLIKQEEYNEILGIPKNAIEQRAMLEVEAENLEIKIELIEKELQAETLAQEEKVRLLKELNEYQDLYLKNTDNRAKAEINIRKATTDAIQSGLGITKSVLKDAGALAGEHTAAGKALAIAAATIDTYQSATMAYKSQLPLGPAGPALGIAAATAAVASGLANIKRIAEVKVPGKGSDGQGGGMPNIQQPEFLEPVKFVQESYTNLSGDDLDIINNKNQTHKVIVVESDITNVQNRVRAVENDSSF